MTDNKWTTQKTKKEMREKKNNTCEKKNNTYEEKILFDGESKVVLENSKDHYGQKIIERRGNGWVYCFVEGWDYSYYAYFAYDNIDIYDEKEHMSYEKYNKNKILFDGKLKVVLSNPKEHYGQKIVERRGDGWAYCYVEGYGSPHYVYFPHNGIDFYKN